MCLPVVSILFAVFISRTYENCPVGITVYSKLALLVLQVLAPCCLFLAAKVEEQPRKLEHVIRVAHACLHRDGAPLDIQSEV